LKKLIISTALFASGYGLVFALFLLIPAAGSNNPVVLTPGMPFKEVTRVLEREGIIRNRFHFRTLATMLGATRRVEAGEYLFSGPVWPLRVLLMLIRGDVIKYTLTIPEGATLRQIAQLLAGLGLTDESSVIARTSDPDFIHSLGFQKVKTLEGYLFPETYKLKKGMTADEMITVFVDRFKKEWTPDMEKRAHEIGMSPYEALILASIIEKEAKLSEERPLISAVFHNRLKRGMPLQADPTIIYGLGINGRLRKSHLKTPNPYNTYLNRGLPPTPIGNPGLPSLVAALNPAKVPYLYFVSRNDGSHVFTSNLKGHNVYVNKYQRAPKTEGNRK